MTDSTKNPYDYYCEQAVREGKEPLSETEWLKSLKGSTFPESQYLAYSMAMTIGGEEPLTESQYLDYIQLLNQETPVAHPIKDVHSYIQGFPVEFLTLLATHRRNGQYKLLAQALRVTPQHLGTVIKRQYGYTGAELERFQYFSALTKQPICGDFEVVCMHGWVYDELAKLGLPIQRGSQVFGIRDNTFLHLIDVTEGHPVGYALKHSTLSWGSEVRMAAWVVPKKIVFNLLGVVEIYTPEV